MVENGCPVKLCTYIFVIFLLDFAGGFACYAKIQGTIVEQYSGDAYHQVAKSDLTEVSGKDLSGNPEHEVRKIRSMTLSEAAQRFIEMRNACAPLLPKNMFRDISWDLMLELFLAAEQGDSPFIKQLQSIAGEPMASAMRRIDGLEESGLLRRKQAEDDHRRVHVSLTHKGYVAMANMLRHLYDFSFSRDEEKAVQVPKAVPKSFSARDMSGD
jgi:DNA-binding MarR family transcriptional regulator